MPLPSTVKCSTFNTCTSFKIKIGETFRDCRTLGFVYGEAICEDKGIAFVLIISYVVRMRGV